MANTKVTGGVIADGTITAAKIASGALDGILNTYLTTNTYATQSYVTTAVNNLIDAAPASLDTLNELAAALNDDANFATTVTNSLATKLNLSGGTLTGDLIVNTNVGIGTASPVAKLHSVGTTLLGSGTWPTASVGKSGGRVAILSNTEDQIVVIGNTQSTVAANRGARLMLGATATTGTANISAATIFGGKENSTSGDFSSYLQLSTAASNGSITPKLHITSGGNIGIGTSSPLSGLNQSTYRGIHISGTFPMMRGSDGATNYWDLIGDGSNTYLQSYGLRNLILSTNVTERMRIDSSGNVGIGTSSPINKFEIASSAGTYVTAPAITFTDTAGNANSVRWMAGNIATNWGNFVIASTSTPSTTDYTSRLTITKDGLVGIGTSSPPTIFYVSGAGNKSFDYDESINRVTLHTEYNASGTTENELYFITRNGGNWRTSSIKSVGRDLTFNTGGSGLPSTPTERMRINSAGNVLVGRTNDWDLNSANTKGVGLGGSSGYIFASRQQNACSYFKRFGDNGDTTVFYRDTTQVGSISVTTSSTSFNTSSDYRLKENVVEMTGALDRINALKPSRFNFVASPEATVDGFLAHEVAEVVPEAITGEKDAVDEKGNPVYQGIDQSKLVPLLVGAIKELRAEIQTLKSQINA